MNLKKYNADYYYHMLYKIKTVVVAAICTSLFIACSSALYMPSKKNVAKIANIEELQKGRAIYVSKCNSCHTLRLPEKYTKTEWIAHLDKMAPRAKITDEEKRLILAYVTKGE